MEEPISPKETLTRMEKPIYTIVAKRVDEESTGIGTHLPPIPTFIHNELDNVENETLLDL